MRNKNEKRKGERKNKELRFFCALFCFVFKSAPKYAGKKKSFPVENTKITIDTNIKNRTVFSFIFRAPWALRRISLPSLQLKDASLHPRGPWPGRNHPLPALLWHILSRQVIDLSKLTQRHSQRQHQVDMVHMVSPESLKIT